ncbi:helix-turn-helix domain-containing protein [Streptomyces sp. NBC_00963]|uniref:helix-turn-helix domain-containing protein n=2 Tax=unclassified Streptomyces TaxID=2593676 RepID=UPI003868E335|nr:helix-turn-helix domain-containing protein [Streptomyces sp. NBC_00963]
MGSETEEFAMLLRELKERSGRSYGVIAGKLHMSTSTVHRYCNGDAVPTEYAPVERFARLCAATPEELLALHRRWLLADAARRRPKDTAPVAVKPEAAAPDVRGSGAGTSEAGVPEGRVPDVGVPEVRNPGVRDPDVRDPDVRNPEVAGPDAVGPELPPATLGPDRAPAPSRGNRRRWLIGAAVVAVAAVAVPVAVTLRSDDASHVSSVAGGKPVPPAGESLPGSPSPRPSGSVSPSPSPSRTASSTPAASHPAPDAGDLGADGRSTPAVPLTVNVRPYVWDDQCSQSYLVDRPAAKMPPPPAEQDAASWATALGGVSSGGARIELSVQGKTADAVVLQALHVRIVGRHAPLAWNSYAMGDGCGGGLKPAGFDVNLDAGTPLTEPAAGVQGDRKIPATDFPYRVSSSDPQVLEIKASTAAHDVSWYLDLQWSSGDRHGTIRLDDHGKPFRASSVQGRPRYVHPLGGDTWEPALQ